MVKSCCTVAFPRSYFSWLSGCACVASAVSWESWLVHAQRPLVMTNGLTRWILRLATSVHHSPGLRWLKEEGNKIVLSVDLTSALPLRMRGQTPTCDRWIISRANWSPNALKLDAAKWLIVYQLCLELDPSCHCVNGRCCCQELESCEVDLPIWSPSFLGVSSFQDTTYWRAGSCSCS